MEKIFMPARITQNLSIAPAIFSMELHAPEVAKAARPGQFVMIYLDRGELLLPRPISICDVDADAGTLELVYQAVGKGTAVMAEMLPAQHVQILGPLGNGSCTPTAVGNDDISRERPRSHEAGRDFCGELFCGEKKFCENYHAAIVGGGIGVPPLYFLAKELAKSGVRADIFLGFRDTPIMAEKFRALKNASVFIATENGSVGERGYVTEILAAQSNNRAYTEIFSCGPTPMLRAVAEFSRAANIPCQVSVEERMACGLGTCVGCVVRVGESYVRVCTEGPVFRAEEIF